MTVQVTAVFDDPLTAAVNCRVAVAATDALDGATLTVTGSAAVRIRRPAESSGATKQLSLCRERPKMASTAFAAAAASA